MSILFKNANLLLPDKIIRGDLKIKNGIIDEIGFQIADAKVDERIDLNGKFIIPGFVDIHNHGASGFDFSFGRYDLEKDSFDNSDESFLEGIEHALKHYYQHGVTSVLLTTMAAPLQRIEHSFSRLKTYLQMEMPYHSLIKGINLEGTFLKDPHYAGAQNPKFFYKIDARIIHRLQKVSGNLLKIVNVPPEHGEQGLELTRLLRKNNVVVAGGHTAAYGDEFLAAVAAGLSLSVHFFNGPSRSSAKGFRSGGAEEIMLKADEVFLELICDGYHIDPAYVRDAIRRKENSRIIMITDSMFANGLKELNQFELFGLGGAISDNGEYLQLVGSEDTLFGSVLCSDQGFQNVVHWLTTEMPGVWYRKHPALSLEDALCAASAFASSNPARLMGVFETKTDRPGTGSIEVGKWADLIVVNINDNENVEINIEDVFSRGKIIGF